MSALPRPRHWIYLDDERTHEVHALVEPRIGDLLFTTTEFPAGSLDPAEVLMDERALGTTAQLDVALRGLEERLALLGTYYRADAQDMRWTRVAPPPAARAIDLRAHEIALPGAAPGATMGVHHFHGGASDTLLISLPRSDLKQPRAILASVEIATSRADDAKIEVLHTRLAPATLRASLARQHIELPARGLAKLVDAADYERALGPSWMERARDTFRLATSRLLAPPAKPAPPQPERETTLPPRLQPARLAQALSSAPILALRLRHVGPDAERILAGGELSIRRFVQSKRKRADHHTAFDLSILESSLLVEYGLREGKPALLDEEGGRLLRYAGASRLSG
jgi:hypothetical protein